MDRKRLKLIDDIGKACAKAEGKVLFWKTLKEQYLKLETDEEKNMVLSHIFADKEKEGN